MGEERRMEGEGSDGGGGYRGRRTLPAVKRRLPAVIYYDPDTDGSPPS